MTATIRRSGTRGGASAAGPAPAAGDDNSFERRRDAKLIRSLIDNGYDPEAHAPSLTLAAMCRAVGMRCDQDTARPGDMCYCGKPTVITLTTDNCTVGCCGEGLR
jgi:hypothetical protein